MKLEEMKRIASARTAGNWDNIDDVPGAVTHIDFKLKRPMNLFGMDLDGYAVCMHKPDAEFIAMAANNFEKLLAVVEAAKENLDTIGAYEDDLKEALKALEAE